MLLRRAHETLAGLSGVTVLWRQDCYALLCFIFVGAHIARQFEFVQAQWISDGRAFGAPIEKDPLVGPNDGTGVMTSRGSRSGND